MTTYVAVCGAGLASAADAEAAEEVGRRLAEAGAVVVTGGMGGVMDAASRGATASGGTVVGLLPGPDRAAASAHLTVSIPTGMGEGRNVLVVRAADALIAVGGEWGTLSEIALARKLGIPVVGLGTWKVAREGVEPGIVAVRTAEEAVTRALAMAGSGR